MNHGQLKFENNPGSLDENTHSGLGRRKHLRDSRTLRVSFSGLLPFSLLKDVRTIRLKTKMQYYRDLTQTASSSTIVADPETPKPIQVPPSAKSLHPLLQSTIK